jgi:hypothetical protein
MLLSKEEDETLVVAVVVDAEEPGPRAGLFDASFCKVVALDCLS